MWSSSPPAPSSQPAGNTGNADSRRRGRSRNDPGQQGDHRRRRPDHRSRTRGHPGAPRAAQSAATTAVRKESPRREPVDSTPRRSQLTVDHGSLSELRAQGVKGTVVPRHQRARPPLTGAMVTHLHFGSAGLVGSTCCRWPTVVSHPHPPSTPPAPPTGRRRQSCCVTVNL